MLESLLPAKPKSWVTFCLHWLNLHQPHFTILSIFHSIQNPTLFTTNNMIRCFGKSEFPRHSSLYASMRKTDLSPNNYTFSFLLQACGKFLGLVEGIQVHAHVIKLGCYNVVYIRNAFIHFYSSCGKIKFLEMVFYENPDCRDLVTWNAMLMGYARDGQISAVEKLFGEMPERCCIMEQTDYSYVQNGLLEQALDCFKRMRDLRLLPNEAILVMVLSASAQLGLIENGALIKEHSERLAIAFGLLQWSIYCEMGQYETSSMTSSTYRSFLNYIPAVRMHCLQLDCKDALSVRNNTSKIDYFY